MMERPHAAPEMASRAFDSFGIWARGKEKNAERRSEFSVFQSEIQSLFKVIDIFQMCNPANSNTGIYNSRTNNSLCTIIKRFTSRRL